MTERARPANKGVGSAAVADARAAAFRRLVDGELDRAYRLAAVILGDRIDAEDAVHDAAVAAWRHWADLRDPDRFEAWFGRILVNTCRDHLRRGRRRAAMELMRDPAPAEHPVAFDSSGDAATRDSIQRAFERLSTDERLVVVLRFEADLAVPAVAARLGLPEGTVKSRLHRAITKLRSALEVSE